MEYKEISTKKGKHYVFCDLKELLLEFYGAKTVEEIETHKTEQGEYIIHCPFCKAEGHTKHKLYIKDDFSVGHCFVCTRDYVNVTEDIDVSFKLSDSLLNFGPWKEEFKVFPLEDPTWSIETFEYDFDDYDEKGFSYLCGRHEFMKDLYKVLDFKFVDGNVAIPFKHNGEIIYYQIRFSNPGAKIRYFMPPISTGHKPPYIIERTGDARRKIIIVEGIFDAIAALIQCPDFTPVAVLGSSISDYQLDFIRDYAGYVEEVLIWMDKTEISRKIQQRVKGVIDYAPIRIIPSYGPDPEEVMKERMKKGLELQWIHGNNRTR